MNKKGEKTKLLEHLKKSKHTLILVCEIFKGEIIWN